MYVFTCIGEEALRIMNACDDWELPIWAHKMGIPYSEMNSPFFHSRPHNMLILFNRISSDSFSPEKFYHKCNSSEFQKIMNKGCLCYKKNILHSFNHLVFIHLEGEKQKDVFNAISTLSHPHFNNYRIEPVTFQICYY